MKDMENDGISLQISEHTWRGGGFFARIWSFIRLWIFRPKLSKEAMEPLDGSMNYHVCTENPCPLQEKENVRRFKVCGEKKEIQN